ncbi:MAG: SPOR domain-containing protein [Flavobacterium sp.]
MTTLKSFTSCVFILISILITNRISAQNLELSVEQDERFGLLLREKIKSNTSSNLNERYVIQIFSGDNANSRKILNDFKQNNNDVDATIIFQSPNYKVLVGAFFNRIEANKQLQRLKNIYPNSFIIKPNKKN